MRELSCWEILLTPLRIKWVGLLLSVVARRGLRALVQDGRLLLSPKIRQQVESSDQTT